MRIKWRASAALLTWMAATGQAAAQTCEPPHATAAEPRPGPADRLDYYFANSQGPDAYRALAGLGDPGLSDWDDGRPAFQIDDHADRDLLHRLFPSVALTANSFPTYDVGACRLEQPVATLKARIAALGTHAPYVEQWLRVQQAVLSRCLRNDLGGADQLPPPMPLADRALAQLQRQDRAYQAAALLFYQHRAREAAKAFERIGTRPGPHRAFAHYMAVAIRAGTEPKPYGSGYAPLIPSAQSIHEAQSILADPKLIEVHPLAYDLIGWIAAQDGTTAAHTVQARQGLDALEQPLTRITADPEAHRRYSAARSDLRFEFSTFPDQAAYLDGSISEEHTSSRAMAAAAQTDPLAAWIVLPVSPYQTHAWATVNGVEGMARVQADLERRAGVRLDPSNPWVHQALAWREHGYDAQVWSMVEQEGADASRCGGDRALAAAGLDLFHQVRTALMYGVREDEPSAPAFTAAVMHLQRFPFPKSHSYGATLRESLRYLMATGRLAQARGLRDALGLDRLSDDAFMRREGLIDVLILLAEDEDHLVPLLSGDAYDTAGLLNRLLIAELRRLAERRDVATEDRATFARLAWARTYALGQPVAPDLNRLMRSLNPDITQGWLSSPDDAIRPADHVALLDVLATPALNVSLDAYGRRHANPDAANPGHTVAGIDHNKNDDDNWWCPIIPKRVEAQKVDAIYTAMVSEDRWETTAPQDWTPQRLPASGAMLASSFILRTNNAAELAALSRIETAPKLLTERTIAWIRRPGLFGTRSSQPEALALAIQTTRWGCDWAGPHGAYSHAAFDLLHQRFAGSETAKGSKYWYDCNGYCRPRDEDLPPEAPKPRTGFWSRLFELR
ncbi:hypothetical protein [Caulobacter sp. S45]|uniref:hypothetical protein n=1 Tax=Caulobacter sp. S45 TaxID=1641861 RepID=UPI00131D5D3B|nr:hypothetical protein [Caulobacter sp. S45]